MQHYQPLKKPWYDIHSKENNPLRNGLHLDGGSSGLDNVVERNYVTDNSNSWVNRAAKLGLPIFAAVYMAACGGSAPPVVTESPNTRSPTTAVSRPVSSPVPVEKSDKSIDSQIRIVPQDLTVRLNHRYESPSNPIEQLLYNHFGDDDVGYMEAYRSLKDIMWTNSALGVVLAGVTDPLAGLKWVDL